MSVIVSLNRPLTGSIPDSRNVLTEKVHVCTLMTLLKSALKTEKYTATETTTHSTTLHGPVR